MAIYRNVHLTFWSDTKVTDEFTPEDKYFYLYLLTNPHTNLSGCYEISLKQISREMGYTQESIEGLIKRFSEVHKIVVYDKNSKEMLLINWSKYNWTKSSKFITALEKEIESVKSEQFKEFLKNRLYGIDTVSESEIYPMDTVSSGNGYPMDTTVTDSDTVSDTDSITDNKDNNINTQKKETYKELFERLLLKYNISDYLLESVKDWLEYKIERNRFRYKEKGLNSLLNQVNESARKHGDESVANAIRESIASGYQGIVWDKVSKGNRSRNNGGIDWDNV